MALQIPERDRDQLSKLLKLDVASLDSLYGALEETSPRLRVDDLVSDVGKTVPIARPILKDVLRLLLTLYWLRADQNLTAEEIVAQLFQAADDLGDDRIRITPEIRADVGPRLARFLSLEHSLGVTSKALYVAYQFPRHYHGARILTDARPVFAINPAEPPTAFIVNHTIQLRIHDDGKDREWFLSLNTDDLIELNKTIERALEKEKSLKLLMSKTGVPVLDWKGEDEHGD